MAESNQIPHHQCPLEEKRWFVGYFVTIMFPIKKAYLLVLSWP